MSQQNNINGKIIILSGFAGSGKDFFSEKIGLKVDNKEDVAFANRFKDIISRHIPKHISDRFQHSNRIDLLNDLKNNQPDVLVYDDMNMRKFMQTLLGGAVRDIQKDIHCAYLMEDYYNILDNETLFVCVDNRYENEQDFVLNINSLNNNEDRANFVLGQIKNITQSIDSQTILDKFDEYFPPDKALPPEDFLFIDRIKHDFITSISNLKKLPEPKKDIPAFDFSTCDFSQFNENDFGKLGLFRVFRKAVSDNFNFSISDEDDISREIQKVAALTEKQADKLIEDYKSYNLPLSDLKIYGVCRTNPTLPSERELIDKNRTGIIIENVGGDGLTGAEYETNIILDLARSQNQTLSFFQKIKPPTPN